MRREIAMAATKRVPTKIQQEQTRAAIQTTQLVKRLQCFALGLPEPNSKDPDAPPVELDGQKIKAIEILLRKALPDLSSVALTGDKDADPIQVENAGAAKLTAFLNEISGRASGEPDAE